MLKAQFYQSNCLSHGKEKMSLMYCSTWQHIMLKFEYWPCTSCNSSTFWFMMYSLCWCTASQFEVFTAQKKKGKHQLTQSMQTLPFLGSIWNFTLCGYIFPSVHVYLYSWMCLNVEIITIMYMENHGIGFGS